MDYQERIIAIGLKIKSLRQKRNFTQLDLAAKCGIEQTNLARIELGKTSPTIKTLFKLADALEIDIKELF